MTLYLDTSALVKLYAEEENREVVFEAVDSSGVVATSTVAYAETRAALARRLREDEMSEEEQRRGRAVGRGVANLRPLGRLELGCLPRR